jgi:hypothetical protein
MRVKALDLLLDVRSRLADPTTWTTGEYARNAVGRETDPGDPSAVRWCGQGAIYANGTARGLPALATIMRDDSGQLDWARPLFDGLDAVSVRFGFKTLVDANDRGGREVVLCIIESAVVELELRASSKTDRGSSSRRSPAGRSRRGSARRIPSFLATEEAGVPKSKLVATRHR